jgi:hypothetical protein
MNITVKEISTADGQAWNQLVGNSPQRTVFVEDEFLTMWTETNPTFHLTRIGCYDDKQRLIGGQAFLHKKVLGIRLSTILNIFYASTPLLNAPTPDEQDIQAEILNALANYVRKKLPFMLVEAHPSLMDVRPYLYNGWEAAREYTHLWDLRNLDLLMDNMHRKGKTIKKAQKQFVITRETGAEAVAKFAKLYKTTMQKFNWKPSRHWTEILQEQVKWMEARDMFRLYSCHTLEGELAGMTTLILSHTNRTAYGWMMGYNPSSKNREWGPVLQYYTAQELASNFDFMDFGEGTRETIYVTKDNIGTTSVPFWVLRTKQTHHWLEAYEKIKNTRYALTSKTSFD